jgi:hypothetical protein
MITAPIPVVTSHPAIPNPFKLSALCELSANQLPDYRELFLRAAATILSIAVLVVTAIFRPGILETVGLFLLAGSVLVGIGYFVVMTKLSWPPD